jgi:hypothetical protein
MLLDGRRNWWEAPVAYTRAWVDLYSLAAMARADGYAVTPWSIRRCRLMQDLTQRELALSLWALGIELGLPEPGLDACMVSKWERGTRRPSAFYRALLVVWLAGWAPDAAAGGARSEARTVRPWSAEGAS